MSHGTVPDSLDIYRCEDCGETIRDHSSFSTPRCPNCRGTNTTEA